MDRPAPASKSKQLSDLSVKGLTPPKLTRSQQEVLYKDYKDFEMIRIEGSRFGDVIKCSHRNSSEKKHYAIKIINIPQNQKKNGVPCSVIRQVSILKQLKHPNIVRLLDVMSTEDDVYLVFEFVHISLHKFLYNPMVISFASHLKNVLRQILDGIAYFHSHKIVHRDLRPHNILLDASLNVLKVKLTGFGAARTFEVPLSSYSGDVGSRPCYTAPELLFGSTKYSTAIDMWSLGCIFAEMIKLEPLFTGQHKAQILVQIFRLLGTPTEETWPGLSSVCSFVEVLKPSIKPKNLAKEITSDSDVDIGPHAIDLLSKMLCMCPERRISAEEALKHRYFTI